MSKIKFRTPRRLADENGNIVWSWESKAFGDDEAVGIVEFNLRFAGQYYDDETSTHYNINRDYDPKTGRYIQSDPIGFDGGVNSYGYVSGNPLGTVDELGLNFVIDSENYGTSVFNALTSVVNNLYKTPQGKQLINQLKFRTDVTKLCYTPEHNDPNWMSGYIPSKRIVAINPYYDLTVYTSSGKMTWTPSEVILAHELGHAMGTAEDDGSGTNMLNVNKWENPVRKDLRLEIRTKYSPPQGFKTQIRRNSRK